MKYNYGKVILYKISRDTSTIERVVFTEHHKDWKLVYDKLGDSSSLTKIDAIKTFLKQGYEKQDLINKYVESGFKKFKDLNPAKTVWEEYYTTNDNDLKELMLKWKIKPKKKRIIKVKKVLKEQKS
jgi:hypothetical protein